VAVRRDRPHQRRGPGQKFLRELFLQYAVCDRRSGKGSSIRMFFQIEQTALVDALSVNVCAGEHPVVRGDQPCCVPKARRQCRRGCIKGFIGLPDNDGI